MHDTLAILDLWSRHIPAERVHLITAPRRGADPGLLWQRFAALIDVDPDSVDLSRARANASLGLAEVEFLRRLNQQLSAEVPDWFYMWNVKEALAHEALASRAAGVRLVLPDARLAWAQEHAEALISGLRASDYDIVGDLDELRPQAPAEPAVSPADQPAEQMLDAAVQAAAALVLNQYQKEHPAARPQKGLIGRGGAGRPRRVDRGGLAPDQADGARAQQPPLVGASAADTGVAGAGAVQGTEEPLAMPGSDGRCAAAGDQPRVIAVIVTYNRRDLVLEALGAVCGQRHPPDGVIVVDNASDRWDRRCRPGELPGRAPGRAWRELRRRGRLRVRDGAGPRSRRGLDLADGRRHGARARRARGAAAGPAGTTGPAAGRWSRAACSGPTGGRTR